MRGLEGSLSGEQSAVSLTKGVCPRSLWESELVASPRQSYHPASVREIFLTSLIKGVFFVSLLCGAITTNLIEESHVADSFGEPYMAVSSRKPNAKVSRSPSFGVVVNRLTWDFWLCSPPWGISLSTPSSFGNLSW